MMNIFREVYSGKEEEQFGSKDFQQENSILWRKVSQLLLYFYRKLLKK